MSFLIAVMTLYVPFHLKPLISNCLLESMNSLDDVWEKEPVGSDSINKLPLKGMSITTSLFMISLLLLVSLLILMLFSIDPLRAEILTKLYNDAYSEKNRKHMNNMIKSKIKMKTSKIAKNNSGDNKGVSFNIGGDVATISNTRGETTPLPRKRSISFGTPPSSKTSAIKNVSNNSKSSGGIRSSLKNTSVTIEAIEEHKEEDDVIQLMEEICLDTSPLEVKSTDKSQGKSVSRKIHHSPIIIPEDNEKVDNMVLLVLKSPTLPNKATFSPPTNIRKSLPPSSSTVSRTTTTPSNEVQLQVKSTSNETSRRYSRNSSNISATSTSRGNSAMKKPAPLKTPKRMSRGSPVSARSNRSNSHVESL